MHSTKQLPMLIYKLHTKHSHTSFKSFKQIDKSCCFHEVSWINRHTLAVSFNKKNITNNTCDMNSVQMYCYWFSNAHKTHLYAYNQYFVIKLVTKLVPVFNRSVYSLSAITSHPRSGLCSMCVNSRCRFRGLVRWRCLFRAHVFAHRRLSRLVLARPEALEMRLNSLKLLLQYFAFPWQHLVQLVAWWTTSPSTSVTMTTLSATISESQRALGERSGRFLCFSGAIFFLVVVFCVAVALPGAVTSVWAEERGRVRTITPPHPSFGLTTITRDSRPRRAVRPSPESPATSKVHWARVVSATVDVPVSQSATSHSVNPRTPRTLSRFLTTCAVLLFLWTVGLLPGILCVVFPGMLFFAVVINQVSWTRSPRACHGSVCGWALHKRWSRTPRTLAGSESRRTIHERWSRWLPASWSAPWPTRWSARWSARLTAVWFTKWSPRWTPRWSAWWTHVRHHSDPMRRSTATVSTTGWPSLSTLSRATTVRSSGLFVRRRFFSSLSRHGVDQRLHVVHRLSLCIDSLRLYKSVGGCVCCSCVESSYTSSRVELVCCCLRRI